MENSKFNINRPPLSDEEIQEAQNFEEIINRYGASQKKSIYKKVAVGTGIIALITVGFIFLFGNPTKVAEENSSAQSITQKNAPDSSVFSKPIIGLDVPYSTFKLDPSKGNQFTLPTGTEINIPKSAFLDSKGNPISGEIELKFREFHDVVSIFAAGIPMTYDSAGVQYHFESAGMFELLAYQNGEPVNSNPERLIQVSLASLQQGANFNLYYLENNTTWNFIKKDTAKGIVDSSIMDTMNIAQSNIKQRLNKATKDYQKALQTAKIIDPQLANDNLYSFKVDFAASDFPELIPYKNVLFEITENNIGFNTDQTKKKWFKIELVKTTEPQIYKTTFFGANQETMTLEVRPVFSKKDIKTAQTTFDKLFDEYDQQNQQKLSNLLAEKQEAYKLLKAEENSVKAEADALKIANDLVNKSYETQQVVKRVFEVANFGMWNSDCPQSLPQGEEIEPLFVNEKTTDDTLTFSTLFLAELEKNALYTLYGSWGNFGAPSSEGNNLEDGFEGFESQSGFQTKKIGFNSKNKTVLWGITKKNQLAILKPKKIEKIKGQKTLITIEMELITSVPKNVSELKQLLGF